MNRYQRLFYIALLFLLLYFSNRSDGRVFTVEEKVRLTASKHIFDFTSWTYSAIWVKLGQSSLGTPRYFTAEQQVGTVNEYMRLVGEIEEVEHKIDTIYANPENTDPLSASSSERAQLNELMNQMQAVAPMAEATLEGQVSQILQDLDLTLGGQPQPWVLYHVTPLPQNLVISRRDRVEQVSSLLIDPNLTVEQAETLEQNAQQRIENTSALVVPVGGVALYPTMVMRTRNLPWTASTIAHEWIHLYLGVLPLGMSYGNDPQVRTMNETTASIAGDEIGKIVMERFYPQQAYRYQKQLASLQADISHPEEGFDFNKEMHKTRITADDLLLQGKIEEAEKYMDERRQVFWDHGYLIRKINQAYFAFYGAYADQPGGAAGQDPVGPAVRELRARSKSLKEFLETIGAMDSFDDLQAALGQN